MRSVRVFGVQKNGELNDEYERNVHLVCEYDSQGVNMKTFKGK